MHWAGIVRISSMGTRKAGDDNVHADRDQVDAIERHAAAMGATVDILPAELDVSGGLPLERRPSLLAAIEGVEAGRYDAIIVAYLSRLGRNVREQLKAWDRVEAVGGRIIVVQEGIDTSTPTGRLQRTIMLGIAEHEREQHAERFENLREWATAAGIWQRRQTPLGYTRDPATRKLVPDTNADRVRRAYADRVAGKPVSAISRDLEMTPAGARALLRNRVYLGELRSGSHLNTAAHPPLLSEDAWLDAQAARVTRPARAPGHPALVAGIARCAGCGHMLSRGGGTVVCYVCHDHHSEGRCSAPAAVTARLLDEHVEGIVLARLAELRPSASEDDKALRTATDARKDAESELAAFLRGVQAAGLKPGQFADGARERADAVERAAAIERTILAARPVQVDGDPVALWHTLDGSERNHLLGRLVEVVLVARAGGRGSRTPLEARVRVIRHGAGLVDVKRYRGESRPLTVIPLPDLDDPRVLGVTTAKDEL
jgi:DNA invertase Pin-like site-specific DNA recombinase